MKLALNLMLAATMQVLAEALAMGEAVDLDRAQMLEVMGASALGSPFVKYKTRALIEDDYTSTFSARLLAKDLDLIVGAANASGVPVPLAAQVRQAVQSCIGAGMGDLDLSALVPLARREAGLTDSLPEAHG
jgi:3-hydroxyisobutyrate dehydrogenase-like beta-hydroxyacid dehydrogenase